MRIIIWLLVLSCSTAWAQKKTVFLITDAEGVGGVCRQDQTDPKDQEMRQLLTGEINAAVEGFLAGGADEVIVWDGHDGSQTLSTLTIHPKAKLRDGGAGRVDADGAALVRGRLCRPAQPGQRPRRHHGAQLQLAGHSEHAAERQAGGRDRRDRRHGRATSARP